MRAHAGSIGIVLIALCFVGANQDSPYELALQQLVASVEKIGTTLKSIVDEDSAGTAKAELRKSATFFLDIRAKAAKLQPPEKDEKQRLEKHYKPKLENAMKKMFTEIRRIEIIPGGKDALKEISGVLQKESKK